MNPVRVVCDTNVLVSALLGSSTNLKIFEAFKEGKIVLLFSKETLAELAEVLSRAELKIPASEIRSLFRVVRKRAHIIRKVKPLRRCRDPKDDFVVATALSGEAGFLITGDKDIHAVTNISGLKIVPPAAFIQRFSS